MNRTTTLWVLWISLMLLIPLPVYGPPWGWLPAAYLLLAARTVSLYAQALVWAAVLWWLARLYCRWSALWPPKIRGSLMALMVFSLLILFSSIPIYHPLDAGFGEAVSFQWLYE